MLRIDLNCDLGEGAGHDAELFPWITSANIACGAHAGDDGTMRATIELALRHRVAVGAHPGFADRENFGRRERPISRADATKLIAEQLQRFRTIVLTAGAKVSHVKLHGALYNQASRDPELAEAVIAVMSEAGRGAALFVLAGSELERRARDRKVCPVIAEVFADRSYQANGTLTPRGQPGAILEDENAAVAQALRMVREGKVRAVDGSEVSMRAETICLHGDGAHAEAFARRLNAELKAAGVELRAV